MSANREKTSNVMGFVVSVLLHAIFFAGCLALDYTHADPNVNSNPAQIHQELDKTITEKSKS